MADVLVDVLHDEAWCSTHTQVNAVSGGGLVSGDEIICFYGENLVLEYAYVPYEVTDPAGCSDATTMFTYMVVQDPAFSFTNVHLSADPYDNVLRLELGAGVSTTLPINGAYTMTV